MWMMRKMLRVKYTDHITNDEVLRRAKSKRSLKCQIMKRKVKYFGHMMRAAGLQKRLLQGKIEGQRRRGRPRRTWMRDITEWTQLTVPQCMQQSGERRLWRRLTADLPGGGATTR